MRTMAPEAWRAAWPRNVWAGATVEDQERVQRILDLVQVPARVRFLSCEPLLECVDLGLAGVMPRDICSGYAPVAAIHWVICGGESGPGARPMHPAWARSLRDQCVQAGVPFHFKQWGEHDETGKRVGKRVAGRILDGRTWDELPEVPRG